MLKIREQISKGRIFEQIVSLGVKPGDIVFLSADLLRVGYYSQSQEKTYTDWIDILTEAVGDSGT